MNDFEEYLVQQISECEPVAAHFGVRLFEEWFYDSGSLGLGPHVAVPTRPYIVKNETEDFVHQVVRETSNARNRTFRLYVYDHKGDFTRINNILEDLRDLAKSMSSFVTPGGVRCSDSLWLGISGRFQDDGYDSCTRYGSIRFTVSD